MLPVRLAAALHLFTMVAAYTVCAAANADTITVTNATYNVAYAGDAPTPYFSGANPYVSQAPIGTEFATSAVTVTMQQTRNGAMLALQYLTAFSGAETLAGVSVDYADIFLRPTVSGYSAAPFTYAVSLGMQSSNGGLAAGLYSVGSYATSQDIWAPRHHFMQTGQYTDTATLQPGQAGYQGYAAPTVLTAGTRQARANTSTTLLASGLTLLNVEVPLTAAQAGLFDHGFDMFWGTADCANGSFLASIELGAVPEPASFACFVVGLFAVGMTRRRGPMFQSQIKDASA